jgi:hypothetical protein
MVNWNERLYIGTWDWSILLKRVLLLDGLFSGQYGTDVYSTDDGVHWRFETRQGFGNPNNFGTRSWGVTPYGLFIGTAKPSGGADLFTNQSILDFDGDNDIDQNDVDALQAAIGGLADRVDDPRDIDRDGVLTANDVAKLRTQCTKPGCAVVTQPHQNLPAPTRLASASAFIVGPTQVALTWDPVPGAAKYIVFRAENRPVVSLFPESFTINLPEIGEVQIPDDFTAGRFDEMCALPESEGSLVCLLSTIFKNVDKTTTWLGLPLTWVPVATTTTAAYAETARSHLQALYIVVAVDAAGRRSQPSNFVGGPSWAVPETIATARTSLRKLARQGSDAGLVAAAEARIAAIAARFEDAGPQRSRLEVLQEIDRVGAWMRAHPGRTSAAADVRRVLLDVADTLLFIDRRQYPATVAWRDVSNPGSTVAAAEGGSRH